MVMLKPPEFGTCTQQRANQCARKCDSDLKILECGIGITANWFRDRMTLLIDIWRFLKCTEPGGKCGVGQLVSSSAPNTLPVLGLTMWSWLQAKQVTP